MWIDDTSNDPGTEENNFYHIVIVKRLKCNIRFNIMELATCNKKY